jgi:uncharacterized membrane protein YcaP (DUF421 family)
MQPEARLDDWKRLLLGDAPLGFLAEILLRLLVVYVVMLVVMRLLGKRMSGQLSNVELAVMLLLGAIVGAPLTIPERGLVPAIVLLVALVALQRGLNALGARSEAVETLTQGRSSIFVKNGRILRHELEQAGISNEQLFATLRARGIAQLGELRRVYFEPDGEYSLVRAVPPAPGLTVQPASDRALQERLPRCEGLVACERCGHVVAAANAPERCEHCQASGWSAAVAT